MPEVPKIELPAEVVQSLSDTSKRYSDMCTIRCAVDYIVDVVLTGKMDDELAARNPLRNKICHGDQTEYDTKEHSLKVILVTDIMIRLGSAVLALQADAECGGESQGQ